jgi:hypothetical protein
MKLEYQHLLPADFSADSRVWIYQSNRLFGMSEVLQIEEMLEQFVESWNSHGIPVKGYANIFFGQFLIIMADESATGVSGCSTDSSVRLVKQIESTFNVSLFDRQLLAFVIKDKIELLPLPQLKYAAENGFVNGDTLYFNNTVLSKADLEKNWIITVKNSWLANRIPQLTR